MTQPTKNYILETSDRPHPSPARSALVAPRRESGRVPGGTLLSLLGLVAIVTTFASPGYGDTVELLDNTRVEGQVLDLGGNSIAVTRPHGRRRIHKGEIHRVIYDLDKKPREARGADVVIRVNGPDLEGKARFTKDGRNLRVETPGGNVISLPRDEVIKVIYSGQSESGFQAGLYYTAETDKTIETALEELRADDAEARKEAEVRLKMLGYFSLEKVRERIFEIESTLDPARPEEPDQVALRRELRLLERLRRGQLIRAQVSHQVEREQPGIYKILIDGTTGEKSKLMDWLFTAFPDDAIPLARVLLEDPDQEVTLKARIIGFLQGLQRNFELVEAYRESHGKVQLALAIALGKNRILIGVPTLLEALSFDDLSVRKLAHDHLTTLTGVSHGYDPAAPSARREAAIQRWEAWWETHRDTVLSQAESILAGNRTVTPQRKDARELWLEASSASRSGDPEKAESLLKQALLRDPTFVNAHVQLAFLYYSTLDRADEARKILEDLVRKPLPGVERESLTWVHYHLGRIAEQEDRPEDAVRSYERALARDEEFFRAAIALADVNYRLATRDRTLSLSERRSRLINVGRRYQTASRIIESHQDSLVLLYQDDLPLDGGDYFDLRAHNLRVRAVKGSLRVAKARTRLGMARVHSLLEQRDQAQEALLDGLDLLGRDEGEQAVAVKVDLRNYLALLYEGQGNHSAAYGEYRKILRDLDPRNPVAQRGLRRTERHLGRRDEAGRGLRGRSPR